MPIRGCHAGLFYCPTRLPIQGETKEEQCELREPALALAEKKSDPGYSRSTFVLDPRVNNLHNQ